MKKDIVFIAFLREDSESIGFLKKVYSQCNALEKLGYKCYLYTSKSDEANLYLVENKKLTSIKKINYSNKAIFQDHSNFKRKVSSYFRLKEFLDFINKEIEILRPEKVYIRRIKPITKELILLSKKFHKYGIKVYFEFPDYPLEIPNSKMSLQYIDYVYDRTLFRILKPYLRKTIAVSIDTNLDKNQFISIRNGIDLGTTPLRQKVKKHEDRLDLVGVANIGFWHAYDRIIKGLYNYYNKSNTNTKTEVYFHVVGEGPPREDLIKLTSELKLEKYVLFYGSKTGKELNEVLNYGDIGVGILGNHRRNFFGDSSLKNREYCARGIPFIIAAKDLDFDDNFPYKMSVPSDDSDINITEVAEFFRKVQLDDTYSLKMRKFAEENLTWEAKLGEVAKD